MDKKNYYTLTKPDNRIYHFKALVKELPITSMTIIEYKDAVEKIYMEVYYPEERIWSS